MLLGTRKALRRTARGLLALMAGAWLLAAIAPCVMAASVPMPAQADAVPCHPDHAPQAVMPPDCDARSALHCQQPQPTPPSAAFDPPTPVMGLAYTLPALAPAVLPDHLGPPARAETPPPPHLSRKHSRLLI